MKNNNTQKEKWIGRHIKKAPVLIVLALFLILSNSVIYLAAFEAHVVNVTATIERPHKPDSRNDAQFLRRFLQYYRRGNLPGFMDYRLPVRQQCSGEALSSN